MAQAIELNSADPQAKARLLTDTISALEAGYRFEAARAWMETLMTLGAPTGADWLRLGTLRLDVGDAEAAEAAEAKKAAAAEAPAEAPVEEAAATS